MQAVRVKTLAVSFYFCKRGRHDQKKLPVISRDYNYEFC